MSIVIEVELGHFRSPWRVTLSNGETIPLTEAGYARVMMAYESGASWIAIHLQEGKKMIALRHLVTWQCP